MKILKNDEWVTVYPVVATDKVDFTGATATTAGVSGSVPAPAAGKQGTFLKGNGSWSAIDYSDIANTPTIPEGAVLDAELSTTSANAVQNKVLTAALNSKVSSSSVNTFTATNYFTGTTYINGGSGIYIYGSNNPNKVVATLTANGYSGTAAIATKANQDSDGNDINTTYAKSVDLAAVAKSGNYNDLSNTPTIPDVSSYAKTTSSNTWTTTQTFNNNIGFSSASPYIYWSSSGVLSGKLTATEYSGLAAKATADSAGNNISTTYAKSSSLAVVATSGSYNDLSNKPTIPSLDGYAKTSVANTWTAMQTLSTLNINLEKYTADANTGTSATPIGKSCGVYQVTGNFTLDLTYIASALSTGDTTVFTARFYSTGDYTLTITNAGTLSYMGSASDVAIKATGTLVNIFLHKASSGVQSVVQATALSS